MTNLDSIFKSRDITLPTKVHLVKAMVFPVVMYGCENSIHVPLWWTPGVGDGQGGMACCNSWDRKESDTTEWLNWTECVCAHMFSRSVVFDSFSTPWTVAHQALLSMGFSKQEYLSGLPCPLPGESSWTRDWNSISCVSCISRWVLYP